MPSLYELQAYAFDKPIEYKKLLVYPVKMENYYEFLYYVQSLLLEKNSTLNGISKTYLEYLIWLQENGDKETNLANFDALLRMCLRKKNAEINFGRDAFGAFAFEMDKERYTPEDFDKLRLLICKQNDIEIPDESIQKEVRDSINEVKRLKIKQSGTIPPTLEDQVVCLMVATGLSSEEIFNLSIRKFGQLLKRVNAKMYYEIYLTASVSGFVEFKDKSLLKHWMSGEEKNSDFEDTMISIESLETKLGSSVQNNKN
jgi:hypothetical protein